ncbi:MAG: asparagine synthetase B family protein [bacterium]
MIYGILNREKDREVNKNRLFDLIPERLKSKPVNTFISQNVAFGISDIGVPSMDKNVGLAFSSDKKVVVAASGNIFDCPYSAPKSEGTQEVTERDAAEIILATYQKAGDRGFKALNGQFSAAIWDARKDRFLLVRDHLGFEPLFYYWDENTLVFCSSLQSLLHYEKIKDSLNYRAFRNYLLFNYNPGLDTFFKNVKKVRPGYYLVFENERLLQKRYWYLSYQDQNGRKIEDYTEELLELTRDALRLRARDSRSEPGAFLSGGMDSSSVVGLLSGLTEKPIHTFSFRCPEKSVDESHYARVMAEHYQTKHHEIEFTEQELVNLENMTEWMEEPLCDIGVELGSFILGRSAKGEVQYILTGDGGDELYAGHPVYVADKVAKWFDAIPAPLRSGITSVAKILPDSDKKKSLLVKTRRFAYSYSFPAELLSNRWRIYYNDDELTQLCTGQVVSEFGPLHSYKDITDLYADADGHDFLSRSLYGDYQTLVHFHVDRLRLTRAFGIEARFPLHDYRLIEFSAKIPSELKIKDHSQVKYIQKKALEGILPDEIVHRKNKMGHNVPMKNWMRETSLFRDLLNDVLSESAIKKRGFFKSDYIQEMLDAHLKKSKDYSHRLYSLLILELWLQKNLDKSK